jgi:hypothetical protein
VLRFRTREASRREPIASPGGRCRATLCAVVRTLFAVRTHEVSKGPWWRWSRGDGPSRSRETPTADHSSPRRPSAEPNSIAPQQLSPPTHSVRLDRGIWILRCCLITEAKRDHWSTRAGRNWKRDRRRNLRLVRRASSGSVSPFDFTTSKQLLRCGAAHGACCAPCRVCLGGGLSCWPPLCLSRSSPDAVTPPSPNLMGRPRRDVRSRLRACPSRFSPPVVA